MTEGIILYTEDGDPVKVTLMDSNDKYLRPTVHPEVGVYGYENEDNKMTVTLEKP